jgi:hypothetical protein
MARYTKPFLHLAESKNVFSPLSQMVQIIFRSSNPLTPQFYFFFAALGFELLNLLYSLSHTTSSTFFLNKTTSGSHKPFPTSQNWLALTHELNQDFRSKLNIPFFFPPGLGSLPTLASHRQLTLRTK